MCRWSTLLVGVAIGILPSSPFKVSEVLPVSTDMFVFHGVSKFGITDKVQRPEKHHATWFVPSDCRLSIVRSISGESATKRWCFLAEDSTSTRSITIYPRDTERTTASSSLSSLVAPSDAIDFLSDSRSIHNSQH